MGTRHEHGKENERWLIVLLVVLATVFLGYVYVSWNPPLNNRFGQLVEACIPNAVVALVAIPTVYFLFTKRGIHFNVNEIANQIAESLPASSSMSSPFPQLIAFHDTYRTVDWAQLLSSSHSSLDIVVYYYDSWFNQNHEAVLAYFRKPNTRMRVFVADPTKPEILAEVNRLFPEYGQDELKGKIERTGSRLQDSAKEAGAAAGRVEFYYVPHLLNYSAQCSDERVLALSIFEMFRQNKIDSPCAIVDLTKSEHLAKYWHKELEGLIHISKRVF